MEQVKENQPLNAPSHVVIVKPWLTVNAITNYEEVVAVALLQEIMDNYGMFERCVEFAPALFNGTAPYVFEASTLDLRYNDPSAYNIAVNHRFNVAVKWNEGRELTAIAILDSSREMLAVMDYQLYHRTSARHARIDLIPGGFQRLLRTYTTLSEMSQFVMDDNTAFDDFKAVYPSFDFTRYWSDQGERFKRRTFVEQLLRVLNKRNGHPADGGRLNRLRQLCGALLDVEHNFTIDYNTNMLSQEVCFGDRTEMVSFPLGVVWPLIYTPTVQTELNIVQGMLRNQPLL